MEAFALKNQHSTTKPNECGIHSLFVLTLVFNRVICGQEDLQIRVQVARFNRRYKLLDIMAFLKKN